MKRYNICMVTAGLGIGGAETHVLTLADALADMGHRVLLISDGEYEGRHRHISLPLTRKGALPQAVAALAGILRREHFDIIHAHARYPALICRLAGAAPLVTTAHWVFKTSLPHRLLSVWGAHTLAVSPDIKRYLMREYSLPASRISLTVNGIDTEHFCPTKKGEGRLRILLCSRLDADRAAAAYALILVSERLKADRPFTVEIIGDGTEYGRLCRLADKINRRCGEERVRMLGAKRDVAPYLADCDIFVGVSRAALEAMAAACTVILAGNEGYLSIFSPEEADRAEESNFCCRGAGRLSLARLEEDVNRLISLSPAARKEMGEANRRYVTENYSASRMAADALRVYAAFTCREVVLCGYYGWGNVGDELMRRALTERLRREGYRRMYLLSSRFGWRRAMLALRHGADLMLGGGNLLQDGTSRRSLLFYLAALRACHGRISVVSAGIGPLSLQGRQRTARALREVDTVECRTQADAQEMAALLADTDFGGRIYATADAVLRLSLPVKPPSDRVMIALHPRTAADTVTEYDFLQTVDSLFRALRHENVLLFSMHPNDTAFCRALGKRYGVRVMTGDADAFIGALSTCRLAIGNRLHLGVAALALGIPSLLFSEEEKIYRFVKDTREVADALRLPPPVSLFRGEIPAFLAPRADILAVKAALAKRRTEIK